MLLLCQEADLALHFSPPGSEDRPPGGCLGLSWYLMPMLLFAHSRCLILHSAARIRICDRSTVCASLNLLSRKIILARYGVWRLCCFFAHSRLLRLLLRVMDAVGLVSEDWDDATRGILRGG